MRSIGKRNVKLVRDKTQEIIKAWDGENFDGIEEAIVNTLPETLWDMWEGSDSEIRNIIDEELMNV